MAIGPLELSFAFVEYNGGGWTIDGERVVQEASGAP